MPKCKSCGKDLRKRDNRKSGFCNKCNSKLLPLG